MYFCVEIVSPVIGSVRRRHLTHCTNTPVPTSPVWIGQTTVHPPNENTPVQSNTSHAHMHIETHNYLQTALLTVRRGCCVMVTGK